MTNILVRGVYYQYSHRWNVTYLNQVKKQFGQSLGNTMNTGLIWTWIIVLAMIIILERFLVRAYAII